MTEFNRAALPNRRGGRTFRPLLGLLALLAAILLQEGAARAQYVACPPTMDLTTEKLPEIVSSGGRLRGTVVLADEQRTEVLPAKPNLAAQCVPQLRRFYQDHESPPSSGPGSTVSRPIPGPTLRASLGDVVELTFLNQINTLDYGNSIDRWENLPAGAASAPGAGCDTVTNGSSYPVLSPTETDEMPNCFHGSSTGNLHFHGAHTSPDGTADNVFLGVRPSPRKDGAPVVTGASVAVDFSKFFANCETRLKQDNLLEWPKTWSDMGIPDWLAGQKAMLLAYDDGKPPQQQLWPVDAGQDAAGEFPQYYVGSFPYCFLLPKYPGTENPPGSMQMGQAPGTMWYHAHKHGSTALNVSNGMAGAFIIEDNSPAGYDGFIKGFYAQHPNNRKLPGQTQPAPNWPIQQTTMVVNQLAGTAKLETGVGAPVPFSINGQQVPDVSMYPGEVQLWRIVNASISNGFYLRDLPRGFTWRQTAQDGVQFDAFNYHSRAQRPVFVAAGNRVDILVQAPTTLPAGSRSNVVVGPGVSQSGAEKKKPSTPLMTIVMKGTGPAMPMLPTMPPRPGFLRDITTAELNSTERTLNFQTGGQGSGASDHTIGIDGGPQEKFGEGPALSIPKLGTVEQWKISNTSGFGLDHPFHIHLNPFQVTEVFDPNAPLLDKNGHPVIEAGAVVPLYVLAAPVKPGQCLLNVNDPNTWHPCAAAASPYARATNIWWDVFPIPDGRKTTNGQKQAIMIPGYFRMRTRFVDYGGTYVLHCHILAHEDRGMMLMVQLAVSPGMPMMQHH
jgi:FtsP/CotA-like multicopper oxidase with cupredoxin domain